MAWIEALLAFIVTMMILSTIASMMVETIHRMGRMRETGLNRSLELLFDKYLWPKISRLQSISEEQKQSLKKRYIEQLILPPYSERNTKPERQPGLMGIFRYALNMLMYPIALMTRLTVNEKSRTTLGSLEMIELLAETDIGQFISYQTHQLGHYKGPRYQKDLILGLTEKYEDICESASDLFARQARLLSVVVGLVMAFTINFNAIHLFTSYLEQPELRQKIIAQGDQAARTLQQTLEQSSKNISQSPENINQLANDTENILREMNTLQQSSIPISWENTPCRDQALPETTWRSFPCSNGQSAKPTGIIQWVLSVSLGGLLIGLGGPFWFESFRKLSSVMGVTKQLVSPARNKDTNIRHNQVTNPADSAVEIFIQSARSKALDYFPDTHPNNGKIPQP